MKRIIIAAISIIAFSFNLAAQSARPVNSELQKPAWSGEYSRWRIDINGGYGWRLGQYEESGIEGIDMHNSRLRSGFQYNGGVTYFITDYYGLGLSASNFNTHSADQIFMTDDYNNVIPGLLEDKIDITYIAANLAMRSFSRNGRHSLYSEIGAGCLACNNAATVVVPVTAKGYTAGWNYGIGYDCFITPKVAIGVSAKCILGTLHSVEYIGENNRTQHVDGEETLAHVTASIGLRFNL